jgi:hypothetical protein
MEAMADLDSQTRELLLGYLEDPEELDNVRRRFMALAWQLNSEATIAHNPVTARTSLWLAEYSNGHRDEDELRDLVADLLQTARVSFGGALSRAATGASTRTDRSALLAVVDIAAAAGRAS